MPVTEAFRTDACPGCSVDYVRVYQREGQRNVGCDGDGSYPSKLLLLLVMILLLQI